MLNSVELFAGAGGLGMGVSLAGFKPLAVIERDRWACDTIRENISRGHPFVREWPLWEGDVRDFDWSSIEERVDLLTGGPPCQPFSLAGKHLAFGDDRDMFPATVNIVRTLRPSAFIFENVKGLTRSSFANYYQYILLQLEFPEVSRKCGETWMDHLKALQSEKTAGDLHGSGLTYNVVPTLINAADYGIPQKRERVFIVGFRSDLGINWSFPEPTNSFDSLLHSQWVSGTYWDRHRISKRHRPSPPQRSQRRVESLASSMFPPEHAPWRTVRDALSGIPDPQKSACDWLPNHQFQSGAKSYPGHTGSPVDLPAKTLKAGDHGVPGGENMMVSEDGTLRYFSARESARLQTFPDSYVFHGSWSETMRQLGNAVPVALARTVVSSVAERLLEFEFQQLGKGVRKRISA